jgi:hypothetical protein
VIELEDLSEERALEEKDKAAAEELVDALRSLPEQIRDEKIKELYCRLVEGFRLLKDANNLMTAYKLAILTLAHKNGGDLPVYDKDLRETEGSLNMRRDETLGATVFSCDKLDAIEREEILQKFAGDGLDELVKEADKERPLEKKPS